MNGIERVKAAISREAVDRVPRGELVVETEFIQNYMAWQTDPEAFAAGGAGAAKAVCPDTELAFYRAAGLDLVCVQDGKGPETGAGGTAERFRRYADSGLFVFSLIDGAFQTVMCSREFMSFMGEVVRTPAALAEEMGAVTEKMILRMAEEVESGAHGIIIADDIAYNQGPFVSPKFVTDHLLPCWEAQVSAARKMGVPVFFHSDGNLTALLPAIVQAGFDGLQCIEPAAGMDIGAVKRESGERLCLMGNMDPGLLAALPEMPEAIDPGLGGLGEVSRAATDLVATAAPGGGFIFGTCSGLHGGMCPERVHRMYDAADNVVPSD